MVQQTLQSKSRFYNHACFKNRYQWERNPGCRGIHSRKNIFATNRGKWVLNNVKTLKGNPNKIAVAGESAYRHIAIYSVVYVHQKTP